MRVTIARADLARIITSTIKAVEARNTIPILSNIKLVAADGKLTATATDLDIEITASTEAEIETPGATTVAGALLNGIVGKMPNGPLIALALDDHTLTVSSGRSRFKLQTLPVTDFPDLNKGEFTATFPLNIHGFVTPLAFAMSNETTRYYLCGVYMHIVDGMLKAAATDGHRFALSAIAAPEGVEFDGVIIPAKTVSLLPQGEVIVSVSESKIRFFAENLEIVSKLIDGTYPDYVRIIPTQNDKIVTVDNAALRQAGERVALVSAEKSRAVKISIAETGITLAVNGTEGAATDELDAEYSGEPIDVGVNSQYLANVAGMFPPGPLRLEIADAGSPILFKSDLAPDMLGIVMPMRI